jgi:hypothetical protein
MPLIFPVAKQHITFNHAMHYKDNSVREFHDFEGYVGSITKKIRLRASSSLFFVIFLNKP